MFTISETQWARACEWNMAIAIKVYALGDGVAYGKAYLTPRDGRMKRSRNKFGATPVYRIRIIPKCGPTRPEKE